MWRGVTRGLVFTLVSLIAATALAQQQPTGFVGALDWPDPTATQSGVVYISGWAYDVQQISRIEVYVDESLVTDDDIAFNAGTHTRVMRMPYREFERLVAPHHVHMMH